MRLGLENATDVMLRQGRILYPTEGLYFNGGSISGTRFLSKTGKIVMPDEQATYTPNDDRVELARGDHETIKIVEWLVKELHDNGTITLNQNQLNRLADRKQRRQRLSGN